MFCNILSVLLMYFITYNIQSYYQELQSGVVDLLIRTPNSFADVGSNTDRCSLWSSYHKAVSTNQNILCSKSDFYI